MGKCLADTPHRSLYSSFNNSSFVWVRETIFFQSVIAAGLAWCVCKRSRARRKQITTAITIVAYSAHQWFVLSHLERERERREKTIIRKRQYPILIVEQFSSIPVTRPFCRQKKKIGRPFLRHLFVYRRVISQEEISYTKRRTTQTHTLFPFVKERRRICLQWCTTWRCKQQGYSEKTA